MTEIAQNIIDKASQIKLVIFDVDGVLTDGSLYFGDDGQEYKAFNSKDGHGMKMLLNSGIEIAIITGRTSDVVTHRMENLQIKHVYQGQQDKLPAFESLIEKLQLQPQQVAYVGDDVVDLPILIRVGFAIGVADAHSLVKKHVHWITANKGGNGAARDTCEFILDAQGKLQMALQEYLNF
jgi:3-deoxy-D-manno-octulosonate 8-phosphate phosphatase (KDO 8-P phosphatase)